MALAATLIRLPAGTVGDIYTPVNVQIAVSNRFSLYAYYMRNPQGIYPTIVLLIVAKYQTLNETTLFTIPQTTHNREHDLRSVQFAAAYPSFVSPGILAPGLARAVHSLDRYTSSESVASTLRTIT